MSVSLLDVNVLLALAWPNHVHHAAAHRWFADNRAEGWATCPLTQLGFARLAMQPAVVKIPILFGDVMEALAQMTANRAHRFWPLESGLGGYSRRDSRSHRGTSPIDRCRPARSGDPASGPAGYVRSEDSGAAGAGFGPAGCGGDHSGLGRQSLYRRRAAALEPISKRHPALVNGSQLLDEREGLPHQTTRVGCQRRTQKSRAGKPRRSPAAGRSPSSNRVRDADPTPRLVARAAHKPTPAESLAAEDLLRSYRDETARRRTRRRGHRQAARLLLKPAAPAWEAQGAPVRVGSRTGACRRGVPARGVAPCGPRSGCGHG